MTKEQKQRFIELDRLEQDLKVKIKRVEDRDLRNNLFGKMCCIFYGLQDMDYMPVRMLEHTKGRVMGFEGALDCILMQQEKEK